MVSVPKDPQQAAEVSAAIDAMFQFPPGMNIDAIESEVVTEEAALSGALEKVAAAIKHHGPGLGAHFARTRLLCLENTWNGHPMPASYLQQASALAREKGLAVHLDGARLFNAAVASGVPARELTQHFDSVSVCFSKGLGAPVGSILAGDRDRIRKTAAYEALEGRQHEWHLPDGRTLQVIVCPVMSGGAAPWPRASARRSARSSRRS